VASGDNDGNREEGSLRCDATVSIRPAGSTAFGVKAEVKNLNSFRHVQRALEYEIARQTELLQGGGRVVQETRLFDAAAGVTVSMRSKEEAHDYRYFPEPDLPPLQLDPAWIEQIRTSLPELPDARRRRFVEQYGLPEYDAGVLTQSGDVADYFEAAAAAAGNPKAASNWVMGELMRKANETGVALTSLPIAPAALAGLIRLVDAGTITSPVAKEVFEKMIATGRPADAIVAAEGLARIDDESAIESAVKQVIDANADAVAQYRAGKQQTFGFLVGQVMKATRGKANPARVNELMRRLLDQA
jgi:aspartyl-tRNA(Asn)/glutamyl-tRNA(Gln) amidotransferase subunit B